MKKIDYRLKATAAWQLYTAPFAVTDQGAVTYEFSAIDNAGNIEATKAVTVQVDSAAPTTTAYATAVKLGKKVRLTYRVNDALPGSGRASVSIKIFRGATLKKTLAVGTCAADARSSYSWRCTLARGSYKIKVYATDLVGNVQSAVGGASPALILISPAMSGAYSSGRRPCDNCACRNWPNEEARWRRRPSPRTRTF